jgi:hypothetical protein
MELGTRPSFDGRYVAFPPSAVEPRCVQVVHVPLWIGAADVEPAAPAERDHPMDLENRTQILSNLTEDLHQAEAAFLEKRTPSFGNRDVNGDLRTPSGRQLVTSAGDRAPPG